MFFDKALQSTRRTSASGAAPLKGDDHIFVDLKLDARLKPTSIAEYKKIAPRASSSQQLANRLNQSAIEETYAIGSGSKEDQIYFPGDLGLFGCVFEAWKNHWILRTRPEDWWGPVAFKIAKEVDSAAKGMRGQQVRELFVSHEGKENIAVALSSFTIYDSDYELLFSQFSSKIEERIKQPQYARAMQNDFGTSDPVHKISSQINLMASMQEFFSFEMECCGCGLRGLEMAGSVEDWEALATKLKRVRQTLEPIKDALWLMGKWWKSVLYVFENLANTRKNPDHPAVAKFWIDILMNTKGTKWVGGGGSMPGTPVKVDAYNGWLISFLTDRSKILAEDLKHGGEVKKQLSGYNSVPMKVSLTWCQPPIEDESTVMAGIVGFQVHKGETKDGMEDEAVPSVEANHMWAMMLPPESKLRGA